MNALGDRKTISVVLLRADQVTVGDVIYHEESPRSQYQSDWRQIESVSSLPSGRVEVRVSGSRLGVHDPFAPIQVQVYG